MAEAGTKPDPRDEAAARKCTLLSCEFVAPRKKWQKPRQVIITLGGEDGSVDRIAIDARDSVRLVERLAFIFRESRTEPSPAYGSRGWFAQRSILRAQAKADDDVERVYDDVRLSLPDVAEYMNEELAAAKRSLTRRREGTFRPETVVGRLRRAMLVLIDAMRLDT